MITFPDSTAPSGRIFLRHPSHMGSIMVFNDRGTWRKVLILDAKYRTNKQFGLYGIEPPEFQTTQLERPNTYRIDYPMKCSTEAPDSWISENIAWDPLTSRERCDIWMRYKDVEDQTRPPILGCPAVQYCRDIQVNGTPCDLPNIQILARIYVDRYTIDQMDPTVEEYPKWSLKKWRFTGSRVVCSSVECSSYACRYVYSNGYVLGDSKYDEFSVIPILEL